MSEQATASSEQGRGRGLFLLAARCCLLAVVGCASAPPPPPPVLTEMPRSVLEALCVRVRDEGYSADTVMYVVTATQPLITPQSMIALADASYYGRPFDPSAAAEAANRESAPLPVTVPPGSCAWRGIGEHVHRSSDTLTLDLSSPMRNPFERNSFGLFARVSLAREAATWYWVPLGERDGKWAAGKPMLLGMR